MSVARITTRYAKSLFDLAMETGQIAETKESVNTLLEITKLNDFKAFIKSPIITSTKKKEILGAILDTRVNELTSKFVKLLATHGREKYLVEICHDFYTLYDAKHNIVNVSLTSASNLGETFIEGLRAQLATQPVLAGKQLTFNTKINPDLIGGFVVQVGDKLMDASVARKLEDTRKSFTS